MNYDLLLHIDSDEPKTLSMAFNNAANYRNALPGETLRMVLVANGPAVKLFTQSNPEQAPRCAELLGMGLEIKICRNAMNASNIHNEDLWAGCVVVPAGVVEIVRLQREGCAYIKP